MMGFQYPLLIATYLMVLPMLIRKFNSQWFEILGFSMGRQTYADGGAREFLLAGMLRH